jgi:glycosyltransferase involved in cell wall biosynthesis
MDVIVQVHNFYQQPGGEEEVLQAEKNLLQSKGHKVVQFTIHNDTAKGMGSIALAASAIWNRQAARQLRSVLRQTRAGMVHVHNTFPLMSPSVYYAARAEGAAIVQTIHNYRLACLQGFFVRDHALCFQCVGRSVMIPAVRHACYRRSVSASAAAAAVFASHRLAGTWSLPHVYIALTQFAKDKLVEAGLPADRIEIKPNFVRPDPGPGTGRGGYALFVGRVAEEKGIEMLLETWLRFRPPLPLWVAGEGPLARKVADACREDRLIVQLGRKSHSDVLNLMGEAACVIIPSIGIEAFCLVAIEALLKGAPVIASRLGPLPEFVVDGVNGLLFRPGDSRDLSGKVLDLLSSPQKAERLRSAARSSVLDKFTAERNYQVLRSIYQKAYASLRN